MFQNKPLPEKIADRYVVRHVIGSGGTGMVVNAYDPHLDLDVAIKILNYDESGMTAVRLQREAMAAGKLNHLNIARVFDFGQTADGSPYMVMELLHGKSLDVLLKQRGSLPLAEALPIFIQLCEGLNFAHSVGIVHRDLKPANVFVSKGQVKIFDFGVAKFENVDQSLTTTRDLIGSPLYVSPEQARRDESDLRADIYSLGCLMYEVLTGETPFQGATVLETLKMHSSSPPPRLGDEFPPAMQDLVEHCLQKRPENRPQNLSEVIEIYHAIQQGSYSVPARDDTEDSKPRTSSPAQEKPDTSKKSLIMMMVAIAASGAIGLGLVFHFLGQSDKKSSKIVSKPVQEDDDYKINFAEPAQQIKFQTTVQKGLIYKIGQQVTDSDLKELQGQKLDKLEVGNCMIDGSGLGYLKDANLVGLNVTNSRINDLNVNNIIRFKNLEQLAFSSPFVTDVGLAKLGALKKVRRLMLGGIIVTDKGLAVLDHFPNLISLELYAPNATDEIFAHMRHMKKLELLSLMETSISKDAGTHLKIFPKLESLDLSGTKELSDESWQAIAELPLKLFVAKGIKVEKNSLRHFTSHSQIEGLSLESTRVQAVDLKHLKKLNKLVYLNLRDNNITDEMIEALLSLKVKSLDLSATYLQDNQLLRLAESKTLEKLNIDGCPKLSWKGVETFSKTFIQKRNQSCALVGTISNK
ncbi:MAG: protein kinase [Candidatus Melainabacteria bacterium]|nr:protein kinase [Candidatus Melainabacteria bacterium]